VSLAAAAETAWMWMIEIRARSRLYEARGLLQCGLGDTDENTIKASSSAAISCGDSCVDKKGEGEESERFNRSINTLFSRSYCYTV